MTVDVEDYFHVQAFAAHIDRRSWDGRESRVVANTRRLLEMFDEFGVRATFFVLGWVAEREPALIREIHARGHEVACHGYSHRLVYTQTPEEFADETRRAKQILEDIVGVPMLGYRAASYSIVRDSLWALDVLTELGFHYDSSIFPVRHDNYGIHDARREPHRLTAPGGGTIVEWPLSTVEVVGFRLPVAGGGYFRLFPYQFTRGALKRINAKERQPFIFYLHPWEIDPDQPRIEAGWLSRFRHYNNLERCAGRLRRLLADFRFAPALDVLRQTGLIGAEDRSP
jgi:polysaccharide deacetylase family protein (PEP-CTERM system associated)